VNVSVFVEELSSCAKVSEFRNKKSIPQTFEEAIASGDVPASRKSVNNEHPESISPLVYEEEEEEEEECLSQY